MSYQSTSPTVTSPAAGSASMLDASLTLASVVTHSAAFVAGTISGATKVGASFVNGASADSVLGMARDRSITEAYDSGQGYGARGAATVLRSDSL